MQNIYWKLQENFIWCHFNMKQLRQPHKSIMRACFRIWLTSGNIYSSTYYHNDSKSCFQYKILHNALYLNQKLFLFHKLNISFCNLEDEAFIHLFAHSSKTKELQCTVIEYLKKIFIFFYYHHRAPFLDSLKVMIKFF